MPKHEEPVGSKYDETPGPSCRKHADDICSGRRYEISHPINYRADTELALSQIAEAANAAVTADFCSILGPLSIAPCRHIDEAFADLVIPSEPIATVAGAECWVNTGSTLPDVSPARLVDAVNDSTILFCGLQRQIAEITKCVRERVNREIAVSETKSPVRLTAIGVDAGWHHDGFLFRLSVLALGHDLSWGVDIIDIEDLGELLEAHAKRVEALAALATGSIGFVDDVASNIMEAAGIDVKFAIAMLKKRTSLAFRFGEDQTEGTIRWQDGVLVGGFCRRDIGGMQYTWKETYTFGGRLPKSILAGLAGSSVRDLVNDPLLPASTIIKKAWWLADDRTRLTLAIPYKPLFVAAEACFPAPRSTSLG